MGTKNYRRRETKKPKKGTKKTDITGIMPQEEVEVIRKSKKASRDPEESRMK